MNKELRQRMIDAVGESELLPEEKETAMHFSNADDMVTVHSAMGSIMKRLLAHPEFEIEQVRQRSSNATFDIYAEDLEEEFDGRRKLVSLKGEIPVGALMVKKSSRARSGPAAVVSDSASDLRLSQRD